MNFDFSDDAKALREQARRFLDEQAGPAAARRSMNAGGAVDGALWSAVKELGWTAARVPEAHGGLGLGFEEACVLAEELGRSLLPAPLMSTLLATEALLASGNAQAQAQWLPAVASGAVSGALHLGRAGEPVADLTAAGFAVVAHDGQLAVVDCSAAMIEPVETLELVRTHGRIAKGNPHIIGDGAALEAARNRAAVLIAFESIGTAQAAMDMAVAYAKERVAFGQRIGRYQAVKHKCADMYIKLELARAHAMHGAWAASVDAPELAQAAAAARVASLDAVTFAAEENVQLHGGIGFTWESDCQFYYRRSRTLSAALGSRAHWADRLVRALEQRNRAAA